MILVCIVAIWGVISIFEGIVSRRTATFYSGILFLIISYFGGFYVVSKKCESHGGFYYQLECFENPPSNLIPINEWVGNEKKGIENNE